MNHCRTCHSYAINPHMHWRDGTEPELCDVCFWRSKVPKRLTREQVAGLWLRCKAIDTPAFCAEFADAIQDALGIQKEQP